MSFTATFVTVKVSLPSFQCHLRLPLVQSRGVQRVHPAVRGERQRRPEQGDGHNSQQRTSAHAGAQLQPHRAQPVPTHRRLPHRHQNALSNAESRPAPQGHRRLSR